MSEAIKAAQEAIDRSAKIVEEMVAMIDSAPSVPDTKLLSYLQQENEVLIERIRLLEISLSSEREACAKVAEDYPKRPSFAKFEDLQRASENIASLIRGRGEK